MATLTLTVSQSADDANYDISTGFGLAATSLALPEQYSDATSAGRFGAGWRFQNVTLSSLDTINTAYLRLMCSTAHWDTHTWRLTAINQDNTAAFANSAGNWPGERPITSSFIAAESINQQHVLDTAYNFPTTTTLRETLADAIAVVTARAGWASGNALGIVCNSAQDASAATANSVERHYTYDSAVANSDPQLVIDYTVNVNYQTAYPTSVVDNSGNWTGEPGGATTNLHTFVDETVVDDTDYIRSVASPNGGSIRFAVGTLVDPGVDTNHRVRYRYRKEAAGNAMSVSVSVHTGGSQIASTIHSNISTTWTDSVLSLTESEAAFIANYGDIQVNITATQGSGITPTYVGMSAALANTATNNATMSPALPTGWTANDIHVLVAQTSSNLAFGAITGWTAFTPGGITENNTTGQRVQCWWRRAQVGDSAPTVPGIASNTVRSAAVFGVRGCPTSGDPFDNSARSNNAAGTIIIPSTTASVGNTLSVAFFAYEDNITGASQMAGWSTFTVINTATGTDQAMGVATRSNTSAGSMSGASSTRVGATDDVNVGLHFLFAPEVIPARANIAWVNFQAPEASTYGGTVVGALQSSTASSANGLFSLPFILPGQVGDGTATSFDTLFGAGLRITGQASTGTASSANSTLSAIANLVYPASVLLTSSVVSSNASIGISTTAIGAVSSATTQAFNSLFNFGQRFFSEVSSVNAQSPSSTVTTGLGLPVAVLTTDLATSLNSVLSLGSRIIGGVGESTAVSSNGAFAFGWTLPGALLAASDVIDAAAFRYAQRFFADVSTGTATEPDGSFVTGTRYYGETGNATGSGLDSAIAYAQQLFSEVSSVSSLVNDATFSYAQRFFSDVSQASGTSFDGVINTGIRTVFDVATATGSMDTSAFAYAQRFFSALSTVTATSDIVAFSFGQSLTLPVALLSGTGASGDGVFAYAQRFFGEVGASTGTSSDAQIRYSQRLIADLATATGNVFASGFAQRFLAEVVTGTGSEQNASFTGIGKLLSALSQSTATSANTSWFSGLGFSGHVLLANATFPNTAINTAYRLTVQLLSATGNSANTTIGIGTRVTGAVSTATGTAPTILTLTSWRLSAALAGATGQSWPGVYGSGIGFTGATMPVDASYSPASTLIPIANFFASQGTVSALSSPSLFSAGLTLLSTLPVVTSGMGDGLFKVGIRFFGETGFVTSEAYSTDWTTSANVLVQAAVAEVLASMTIASLRADVYLGFITATIEMQKALTKLGVNSLFPGILEYPINFMENITAGHYAESTLTARTEVEEE